MSTRYHLHLVIQSADSRSSQDVTLYLTYQFNDAGKIKEYSEDSNSADGLFWENQRMEEESRCEGHQ